MSIRRPIWLRKSVKAGSEAGTIEPVISYRLKKQSVIRMEPPERESRYLGSVIQGGPIRTSPRINQCLKTVSLTIAFFAIVRSPHPVSIIVPPRSPETVSRVMVARCPVHRGTRRREAARASAHRTRWQSKACRAGPWSLGRSPLHRRSP